MSLKRVLVPAMLGFGVALALIIGQRMNTEAMAVVIGVAVGVAASVPTSLLLVALLRRERLASRPEPVQPLPAAPVYPQMAPPNVIVLNPNDLLGWAGRQANLACLPPPAFDMSQEAGLPRLRVIGDDDAVTTDRD